MASIWASSIELSAVPVVLLVPGYLFDKGSRLLFPRSLQSPRDRVIFYVVVSGVFIAATSLIGASVGTPYLSPNFDSRFVLASMCLGLSGGLLAGFLLTVIGWLVDRWPNKLIWLRRSFVQLRYSSAWDFVAGSGGEAVVMVETKSGKKIYGIYDSESYASEWRADGDIYLSKKLIEKDGVDALFRDRESRGIWISAKDIASITFCEHQSKDIFEVNESV